MKKILVVALFFAVCGFVFGACSGSSGSSSSSGTDGSGSNGGILHVYSITISPASGPLTAGTSYPFVVTLYVDGTAQPSTVQVDSYSTSHSSGAGMSMSGSPLPPASGKTYTITPSGSGTFTYTIGYQNAVSSVTYTIS